MDHIMVSINLGSKRSDWEISGTRLLSGQDGRCDDQYPRFFPSAIVVCSKCSFIVFTIRDQ